MAWSLGLLREGDSDLSLRSTNRGPHEPTVKTWASDAHPFDYLSFELPVSRIVRKQAVVEVTYCVAFLYQPSRTAESILLWVCFKGPLKSRVWESSHHGVKLWEEHSSGRLPTAWPWREHWAPFFLPPSPLPLLPPLSFSPPLPPLPLFSPFSWTPWVNEQLCCTRLLPQWHSALV